MVKLGENTPACKKQMLKIKRKKNGKSVAMNDVRALIFDPAQTISQGSFHPTFNSVHFVSRYPLPPIHSRATESPRLRRRRRRLSRVDANRRRIVRETRRRVDLVGDVI